MKKTTTSRRKFLLGMGAAATAAALPLAAASAIKPQRPATLAKNANLAEHWKYMSETKLKDKLPSGLIALVHRRLS